MSTQLDASVTGTVTLGDDLVINRMGLGTNRINDNEESRAVLRRTVELGVNHIDTANRYTGGASETIIGEVLAPYPHTYIATKGGSDGGSPDNLRHSIEGSLQRLKVEQIPIYYLHKVDTEVPFADQVGTLKELRDEGKIKHVALSNVSVAQLEEATGIVPIAAVQNHYNLIERKHEAVLDYCEANGIVFVPYFPLRFRDADTSPIDGILAELGQKYGVEQSQLLLKWLLRRSPVMLPIPGTLSVEHLESNVAAGALELSDEDYEAIDRTTRPVPVS